MRSNWWGCNSTVPFPLVSDELSVKVYSCEACGIVDVYFCIFFIRRAMFKLAQMPRQHMVPETCVISSRDKSRATYVSRDTYITIYMYNMYVQSKNMYRTHFISIESSIKTTRNSSKSGKSLISKTKSSPWVRYYPWDFTAEIPSMLVTTLCLFDIFTLFFTYRWQLS